MFGCGEKVNSIALAGKAGVLREFYLGDEFYPAIIDKETFDAFEAERLRREKALGRDDRQKNTEVVLPAPTAFRMRKKAHVFNDPYRQAEYVYSLIESEV